MHLEKEREWWRRPRESSRSNRWYSVQITCNMIEARELVLALSPACSITCYNYKQNYKEGTYQAKRHQTNKGMNAKLSLLAPPRIGVPQFVINLDWTAANVNYLADYAAENEQDVCLRRPNHMYLPISLPSRNLEDHCETSATQITLGSKDEQMQ